MRNLGKLSPRFERREIYRAFFLRLIFPIARRSQTRRAQVRRRLNRCAFRPVARAVLNRYSAPSDIQSSDETSVLDNRPLERSTFGKAVIIVAWKTQFKSGKPKK